MICRIYCDITYYQGVIIVYYNNSLLLLLAFSFGISCVNKALLRYYATISANLSRGSTKLIRACKLPLALDYRQSKYILYIYIYIYMYILCTNFEIIFAAVYFYSYELKKVSQNFKILFETGYIHIYSYFCPLWCLFWWICSTQKLLSWRKVQR